MVPNNFTDPFTAVRCLSVFVAGTASGGLQLIAQLSMDFRELECCRGGMITW